VEKGRTKVRERAATHGRLRSTNEGKTNQKGGNEDSSHGTWRKKREEILREEREGLCP